MAKTKLIVVANHKGDVRKSTIVYALFAEMAIDGKCVLLVDVDPKGNFIKMQTETFDWSGAFIGNHYQRTR